MSEMNENKKLSCAVARDLMPLYVENLTEDETTELMREHISECAACAQSFGMQKTKLEIEKKPKSPDLRGVRFFKKSFLKRVALVMAVAIMAVIIAVGGCDYLFGNRTISTDDIHVVGQYQLSDGRIVIAMQVEGYAVNNISYTAYEWEESLTYQYTSEGYRIPVAKEKLCMLAEGHMLTTRWLKWTHDEDERGDIFYYLFDPSEHNVSYQLGFSTPAPVDTAGLTTTEKATETTRELESLRINGKIFWYQGDPLRELTAEEEDVLLRAIEKAGFLESSELLPEVDILDTLMGK